MREPRARVEENHGISANPSHRPSKPVMTCGNSRDRLTAIRPTGEIGGCFGNRSPVSPGGQSDGDQQLDQDHAAGLDQDHQLANGAIDRPAPPDPRKEP